MPNADVPTPGQVEFSADEEKAMRQSSAANRDSAGARNPGSGWGARLGEAVGNTIGALPISQMIDHVRGSADEE